MDEDFAADVDTNEVEARERELLEEMPLPGTCLDERSRKEEWLKFPRAARAAIRGMHEQFGHCLKEPLIEILRASACPEEYVRAAKYFKCPECERNKKLPTQTSKVALPRPYIFNHAIGLYVYI